MSKFIKQFPPEAFEVEFADFITDQEAWDYLYKLKNRNSLTKEDLLFLNIIKNELLYLSSKQSLLA